MSEISFYIPSNETIPTELRVYVGNDYVSYGRIENGFRFRTLIKDEDRAMKAVKE